jgi:hypothetical protein
MIFYILEVSLHRLSMPIRVDMPCDRSDHYGIKTQSEQ